MENQRLTITIAETAKLLRISKGKAYSEAKLGRLPVLKFGRRLVVSRYGLEKMLKEAGSYPQQINSDNR